MKPTAALAKLPLAKVEVFQLPLIVSGPIDHHEHGRIGIPAVKLAMPQLHRNHGIKLQAMLSLDKGRFASRR